MFGTLSNLRSSKSYLALLLLFGSLSNLSGVGATDAVKENDKYENRFNFNILNRLQWLLQLNSHHHNFMPSTKIQGRAMPTPTHP